MTSSYIKMAEENDEFAWDADDFDPDAGFVKTAEGDQWEGEDADLEKLTEEEPKEEVKPKPSEPKLTKDERIREKKVKRREKDLVQKAREEEQNRPRTAEEEAAEKLRLLKLQKESDLETAKQLFGVSESPGDSVDSTHELHDPVTAEDFEKYKDVLSTRLCKFETSPHYVELIDGLLRAACAALDVEDLRKLSKTLSNMATEKQKLKAPKAKKKVKASLGVGKAAKKADIHHDYHDYDDDLGGEYDDFM